jgi:hypothetical protein
MEEQNKENDGTMERVMLLEKLREARSRRRIASLWMTLIVITVTTLPMAYLVIGGYQFFSDRTGVIISQFLDLSIPLNKKHIPLAQQSVDRVAKGYIGAFQSVIDRDLDVMRSELHRELEEVANYAGSKWTTVQQEVDMIGARQEQKLTYNIATLLGPEFSAQSNDRLGKRYHDLLLQKMKTFWLDVYADHLDVVESIEGNIQKMSYQEADLNRRVSMNEAAGILFEFAGVELQSSADY